MAGTSTSSYLLSYGPLSKGCITKHLGIGLLNQNSKDNRENFKVEDSQIVVGKALPGLPNRDSSAGQASTGTSVPLDSFTYDATVSTAMPLPVQAGRQA